MTLKYQQQEVSSAQASIRNLRSRYDRIIRELDEFRDHRGAAYSKEEKVKIIARLDAIYREFPILNEEVTFENSRAIKDAAYIADARFTKAIPEALKTQMYRKDLAGRNSSYSSVGM